MGAGSPGSRLRPPARPLARALLPQDQPLRDGLLRVAVKPRQGLVLRVLRQDAMCSLGTRTAARVIPRPQHRTARPPAALSHLVQEAESLEGLPVLHWARHEYPPLSADAPPQTRARPAGNCSVRHHPPCASLPDGGPSLVFLMYLLGRAPRG